MGEGSELPRPGDTISGKYRIERVLGSGGMSTVFEATHRLTGRRFALKWLRPDMAAREDVLRRFVREARVAGRVKHPNVVEVYDFGEAFRSFYIVMELLEGESLEQRLDREGRLAPDEARRILLPCMRGVARAHAAGVIHRDIKPANIFLCKATEEHPELPKVLDFGISRFVTPDVVRDSPVTEAGVWMGTPQYMSPEQVRGRTVDKRTDVYAFGVVLYELLSGQPAFDAESTSDLMVKIATEHPQPLAELVPGIDPALAAITMRAMARDPAARFPDVESLIAALQSGAAADTAGSIGPAPSQHARSVAPARRRVVVALAAAAALGAVAIGWRLLAREPGDERVHVAAKPRAIPTAGAPDAAHATAPAIGQRPDAAANTAVERAPEPPAAKRTAEPSRPRDTTRRARRKPAARVDGAEPAGEAAARERGTQGQSGVTFELEDFLPRGSGTRVDAPARAGAGTRRERAPAGEL